MAVRGDDWTPLITDPEIQAYLFEEAGEEGLVLAQYIADKQPVSSVDVLENYKEQKPSAVRKILYRLMEARIAEYEKDTDAKGWETFVWKLTLNEVKYVLLRRWKDELANLRVQLKFEEDHEFFACQHMHRRMVFEDAMEIGFQCPVCSSPLQPFDSQPVQKALRERIDELGAVAEA